MSNQLKRGLFRTQYNTDIEIQPVQACESRKWKKIGYRFVISVWDEDNLIKNRIYSDPLNAIYRDYETAENEAIKYINEYVVKV